MPASRSSLTPTRLASRPGWRGPLLAVLGLALLSAPRAAAQAPDGSTHAPEPGEGEDSARSHFRVGELMYGEGRFDEAAAEFDRAYELSGRPQLLYNAFLAHRDAGHVAEAVDRLRQYLEQTPDARDRATLEQRLSAMEATLEQQRREAAMSDEERAALEAERARAAAEAEQHRRDAERLRQERERESQRRNPAPLAILGAGAGVLVAGVIMGVVAKTTSLAELEDNCPGNLCVSGFDLEGTRSEARRRTISTDVLLSVGAATAVTGAVLLLLQRRRYAAEDEDAEPASAEARRTDVSGGCGLAGCNMNVQVSF